MSAQLTKLVRKLISSNRVKHISIPIDRASDVELLTYVVEHRVEPKLRHTSNIELVATFFGSELVELWLADVKQLSDGRVRLELSLLWCQSDEHERQRKR